MYLLNCYNLHVKLWQQFWLEFHHITVIVFSYEVGTSAVTIPTTHNHTFHTWPDLPRCHCLLNQLQAPTVYTRGGIPGQHGVEQGMEPRIYEYINIYERLYFFFVYLIVCFYLDTYFNKLLNYTNSIVSMK